MTDISESFRLPRIALAFTLSRLVLPSTLPRMVAQGLGVFFALLGVVNLAFQLSSGCEHASRMKQTVRTSAYCNDQKEKVNTFQIVGEHALHDL